MTVRGATPADRDGAPIILVRHANPAKRSDRPASDWLLSDEGRQACLTLAKQLSKHDPRAIVSSVEPKAAATARLVAKALSIPHRAGRNLHEHQRTTVPLYASSTEFAEEIKRFFEKPDDMVFGEESATAAGNRFRAAVEEVVQRWTAPGPVVIVAHGTVISLLVGEWCDRDPFEIWRRLTLPSFVVLSRDDHRLLEVVDGGYDPSDGTSRPGSPD